MDKEIKVGQVWVTDKGVRFVVTEVGDDFVRHMSMDGYKFINPTQRFRNMFTFLSDQVYNYSVGDEVSISYKGKQCNGVVSRVGDGKIFVEFHYGDGESVLGLPFAEKDVHQYHYEFPPLERIEVNFKYVALEEFDLVTVGNVNFRVWKGEQLTIINSWYCDELKDRVYGISCDNGGFIEVSEDNLRKSGWSVYVEFVEDIPVESGSETSSTLSEKKMFRALKHLDMGWVSVGDLERIIKLAKEL